MNIYVSVLNSCLRIPVFLFYVNMWNTLGSDCCLQYSWNGMEEQYSWNGMEEQYSWNGMEEHYSWNGMEEQYTQRFDSKCCLVEQYSKI